MFDKNIKVVLKIVFLMFMQMHSAQNQVDTIYWKLLNDDAFGFNHNALDLKNHKNYLQDYVSQKYSLNLSEQALEKLLDIFCQPLSVEDIAYRAHILYDFLPKKNLDDLDHLPDKESRIKDIQKLITPTYVIGKSLNKESLAQIVNEVDAIYQRVLELKINEMIAEDRITMIDSIIDQYVQRVKSNHDLDLKIARQLKEKFSVYHKRLQNFVKQIPLKGLKFLNLRLSDQEKDKLYKTTVDILIRSHNTEQALLEDDYSKELCTRLKQDNDFQMSKIPVWDFLKNNREYQDFVDALALDNIQLNKIIKNVEKNLNESPTQAAQRQFQESRPGRNKQ